MPELDRQRAAQSSEHLDTNPGAREILDAPRADNNAAPGAATRIGGGGFNELLARPPGGGGGLWFVIVSVCGAGPRPLFGGLGFVGGKIPPSGPPQIHPDSTQHFPRGGTI